MLETADQDSHIDAFCPQLASWAQFALRDEGEALVVEADEQKPKGESGIRAPPPRQEIARGALQLPVAHRLQLGEGIGGNAITERSLLSYLRRLIEARLIIVFPHLIAEAVRAHAVDAASEDGVLDGGVACDYKRLDHALARVVSELLDHLVGGLASWAEHDAHAADGLRFSC